MMKKTTKTVFLTMLIVMSVFMTGNRVSRAAGENLYEVLTRANMRREPSVEGKWVMTVPNGAMVSKVGTETNGYSLIEYQGTKGYVFSACLKRSDEAEAVEAEAIEAPEINTVTEVAATRKSTAVDVSMVTTAVRNGSTSYSTERAISNTVSSKVEILLPVVSNANFRRTPSSNGERIQLVQKGTEVIYLDDGENGYYHVRYEGQTGYIYANSVDKASLADSKTEVLVNVISDSVSRPASGGRSNTNVLLALQKGTSGTESRKVTTTAASAMAQETKNTNEAPVNRPSVTPEISYQIGVMTSMRSTPDEADNMITTLPVGADVLVLGNQGGYTMVQYDGMVGYVLGEHVVDSVDYAKLNGQAVLFTVTAYCPCQKCCGNYSPEVTGREAHTATGTVPVAGRTIAVDPSVIPYGSRVSIEGLGTYVAEDCGGGVQKNHIDIFFNTHEEALAFGTKRLYVTIEN